MSPSSNSGYDQSCLPALLPIYYKHLFPYSPYYQWLSCHGDSGDLSKREFSFTLENDIYIRYKSFRNQLDLEKEMQKICPYKIDIGAIYNVAPKDHKRHQNFKALHKELVFDIDMTDYDEVRNCCQGAEICSKCWTLMKIAIKILDETIKKDFGFKNVLWIYSGRRGIHCWVCDNKARHLTSQARTAIVEYMSVLRSGKREKKVKLYEQIHPFINRCLDVMKPYWIKFGVEEQKFFMNQKTIDLILKMIPDADYRQTVKTITQDLNLDSSQRWQRMIEEFKKQRPRNCNNLIKEIILELCSPRLDANVSKGVNHLLKSPFSVHPKTGRICVPIDADAVDSFDPFAVPTISDICEEYEKSKEGSSSKTEDGGSVKRKDLYNETSLGKYMKTFDEFLSKLKTDEKKMGIKKNATEASPYEF